MDRENSSHFSQIVCSAMPVQGAFSDYPSLRFWWQIVLGLHGKPRASSMSKVERLDCVADGFRFYASLYRLLAILLFCVALTLGTFTVMLADNGTWYWVIASVLAACYLWLVSGLGYVGAGAYRQNEGSGITALIAFMVMIIAFLSVFLSAVSVAAHHFGWLMPGPNLALSTVMFVFGIGSYLIEILYLATEGNLFAHHTSV